MENNIEIRGGGIKCDNPNCDYRDDTVKIEEYEHWVNKPCPKCGEILLTQKDYDSTKLLTGIVGFINSLKLPDWMKKERKANMKIKTNGEGMLEIEDISIEENSEDTDVRDCKGNVL